MACYGNLFCQYLRNIMLHGKSRKSELTGICRSIYPEIYPVCRMAPPYTPASTLNPAGHAPSPPVPQRRHVTCPPSPLTPAWGLGPGPSLYTVDLNKKAHPVKNYIPYILKCLVLHVLVTCYQTLKIWHAQQK